MSERRARPGKQLFATLQVSPAHEETGALLTHFLDRSLQHDRWWDEIIWIYKVLVRLALVPHLNTTAKGHVPALQVSLWDHISSWRGVITALFDKQRKLIWSGTGPSNTPGTLRNKDSYSETVGFSAVRRDRHENHLKIFMSVHHWKWAYIYDTRCNGILEHTAFFQL